MLRNVGGEFAESGKVQSGGVEKNGAMSRGGSSGEDIKKGGFSGAAWADNGENLRRMRCE